MKELISELNMSQALRLLVETDLAVKEVGHRVGHNNHTYFVRSFRGAHGTTPLAWRRAARP